MNGASFLSSSSFDEGADEDTWRPAEIMLDIAMSEAV
jgi:hypothetical protein